MVSKRSAREQGILHNFVSGKHFSNDAFKHYAHVDTGGRCPHCQQPDSKKHRLRFCKALQHVRDNHKDAVKSLTQLPEAVFAFGVVPEDNDAFKLKAHLRQEVACKMPLMLQGNPTMVFTDGSCYFGDRFDCALAGSAVIHVDVDKQQATEVERFILPGGDHTPFRAESFAVFAALQKYYHVHIVTDCEAVCKLLKKIIRAKKLGKNHVPTTQEDVWECIVWHVMNREPDSVHVQWVKAHQNWESLPPGPDRFWAYCNHVADMSAKKAVTCDNFQLWCAMTKVVDRRVALERKVDQVHSYICAVQMQYFDIVESQEQPGRNVPNFVMPSVHEPYAQLGVPTEVEIQQSPFGAKAAGAMVRWLHQLQWGQGDHMSCLELYFAWAMSCRMLAPVWVSQSKYVSREDSMEADVSGLQLCAQSTTWIRMVKWWLQAIGQPVELVKGDGLRQYGYSIPVIGLPIRPKLQNQHAIGVALWEYFHQNGRTCRNFNRAWTFKMCQAI
eukprot:Skav234731  [mRNA]  locus=scaffold634:795339:796835:+ [translate_table: standard]